MEFSEDGSCGTTLQDNIIGATRGYADPAAFFVQRLHPSQNVLVDAVDQRAVEIEQENGLNAHGETS